MITTTNTALAAHLIHRGFAATIDNTAKPWVYEIDIDDANLEREREWFAYQGIAEKMKVHMSLLKLCGKGIPAKPELAERFPSLAVQLNESGTGQRGAE